jgi:hypothetical protein
VGPNFACGQEVVIPSGLAFGGGEGERPCIENNGPFTFVDFTGTCAARAGVPQNKDDALHGFYAAVFRGSENWGFFEAEGVQTMRPRVTSLQGFEKEVLSRNASGHWSPAGVNTYSTVQGDTIRFGQVPEDFGAWNLIGLERDCASAVNPAACRAQVVPVLDGTGGPSTPLAQGDFITNTDPVTGAVDRDRIFIPNPFTCQEVIMDYSDAANPFYVDPQTQDHRLCDGTGGKCGTGCTLVGPTTCSCPKTPPCIPPADVSGPMPMGLCHGFYAKFDVGPGVCPSRVGVWNGGSMASGVAVGFQIDFPPIPTTIPTGCTAPASGAVTPVTCAPVEKNGVLDLVPGRYGDLTVQSSGTLVLKPGDYMFDSLQLAAGSELQLPTDQRVRIVTRNAASLSAGVQCVSASGVVAPCDPDSAASSFGLMDLGTSDVVVRMTPAGSIVAPNAPIVANPASGTTLHGDFWSNEIVTLPPSSTVVAPTTNVFFAPNDVQAYPACSTP